MATQIANASTTQNLTGAATFAGAEVGALALVLNRFTTTAIAAATTVTSTTFTITTGKTVDAILLFLKVTAAGPTGTFKVDLQKSGVSQGSVTVNKADLPNSTNAIPVPVLFKLSAGGAGTSTSVWTIVITTTGSGTVTASIASATTTNFTRACRTTTAATAAAADDLYVIGELTGAGTHTSRTVTMDSTAATAYGNGAVNSTTVAGGGIHVSCYGTLSYGVTASTNYILRVGGDLIVYQFGTLNIGVSGTEIPRNSSAVLEFVPVSADGDFGLRLLDNCTATAAGLSRTSGKNVVQCLMTADASASGTAPSTSTLSVDTDTGWLSADVVIVGSTSHTAADCEYGTLNANAGASSIVVKDMTAIAAGGNAIPPTSNRGLLVAHSGTSPAQAEVGLLTRNVRIRSTSTTLMAYVYCAGLASVTFSWVELYYLGASINNKRGVEIDSAAAATAKSLTFCSIHDCDVNGLYLVGGSASVNLTFSNNVVSANGSAALVTISTGISSGDYTFNANLLMRSSIYGFSLGEMAGVCTNNTVVGAGSYGFLIASSTANETLQSGGFDGNEAHSGTSYGFNFNTTGLAGTITGLNAWRNTAGGVIYSNVCSDLILVNPTIFGNNSTAAIGNVLLNGSDGCTIIGGTICGDTTFAVPVGIVIAMGTLCQVNLSGVDMSGVGGIFAPHTTEDFNPTATTNVLTGQIANCKFGAPLITTKTNWAKGSYLSFEKYNQTAGDHRTEMTYGQLKTDSTFFNLTSPSLRMTPNNASNKLESAPKGKGWLVPVANGASISLAAYVYKSKTGDGAAYNGNQPRLIQRANPALGQTSDVVLATYGSSTGSWNQISGNTSTATDDGAWEIIIDCDGTAGWICVDDLQAA